ncbi:MAG: hypothetical protein ACTSU5_04045 [Promethearchaeota archaeon]
MPEEAMNLIRKIKVAVVGAKRPLKIEEIVNRTGIARDEVEKWLKISKVLESELFHVTKYDDETLVVPTTHAKEREIVNAPPIRHELRELFFSHWYDWRRIGYYPLLAKKMKAVLADKYPNPNDLPIRRKAFAYFVEKYAKTAPRHLAQLLACQAYS